jgi:hypothetical protein
MSLVRSVVAMLVTLLLATTQVFAADPAVKDKPTTKAAKTAKPAATKSSATKSTAGKPVAKPATPKKMNAEKAESKRNPTAPVTATKIVNPGRQPPAAVASSPATPPAAKAPPLAAALRIGPVHRHAGLGAQSRRGDDHGASPRRAGDGQRPDHRPALAKSRARAPAD